MKKPHPRRLIDYSAVPLPKPTAKDDHSNYDSIERRAEMLVLFLESGREVSTGKLARLYHVSQSLITHDKSVLREYISKHLLKRDRIVSDVILAKHRSLKGSLEERRWSVANQISDSLVETMQALGVIESRPAEEVIMTWKMPKELEKPKNARDVEERK
jgi:hypothetical protein